MDRSREFSATVRKGYSESSGTDPIYWERYRTGQELAQQNYTWIRFDAEAPLTPYWYGLTTEFNAGGIDIFGYSLLTGKYQLGMGSEYVGMTTIKRHHEILANDLLAKVKHGEVNMGVALGEYKQTAKLFSDTVSNVTDLIDTSGIRDKPWMLAAEYLQNKPISRFLYRKAKACASAWLAFTYGFKPLYNDIVGAAQSLARSHNMEEVLKLRTVRSSHNELIQGFMSFASGSTFSSIGSVSGNVNVTGKVDFLVENPLLRAAQLNGITNLGSVTWELIPYSFVFDWFVPIGNYLQQIEPPLGVEFRNGHSYVKAKGRSRRNTTITDQGWNTRMFEHSLVKDRVCYQGFPQPTIIVPDLSLSKSQMASAVSLLMQRLPDIRKYPNRGDREIGPWASR